MLINLSELFTCEGKRKVYTVSFELGSIEFGGDIYKIVKAEPFELEIANIGGGKKYTMSGGLSVTVEAPCARCLEPVTFVCELVFDRELDLGKKEEQEDSLEVDQLVCNELLLSLPMRVLCSEDCKGICNRCGTNLNIGTCACDTRSLDPRMSVIQEIFNQFKEV
ncbi:DUF177 domain-containing protein [[Clostridium] symbiosum]|uniref:YceD family protein n=1 Tax=Clostridium symbiosum TaxID=1512 RepID=UPI003312FD35